MVESRSPSRQKHRDRGRVRKCMRMDQEKLDRARKLLGAKTETETVDRALDYVAVQKGHFGFATEAQPVDEPLNMIAFRNEVLSGLEALAASGPLQEVYPRERLRRSGQRTLRAT